MDGLPYFGFRYASSEIGARDLPMFYPFLPEGLTIDLTQEISSPFDPDYEYAFPQKVLDLLRPSNWTFSIQYDDGGGFTEVYSATIPSGRIENEGVLGGTSWADNLWNADVGDGVIGIVRLTKTVSGVGSFEPIVFDIGVAQPSPFIDGVDDSKKWRMRWVNSYAEQSPGSAAGQVRIVYDGDTYFATETALRCVITRAPI